MAECFSVVRGKRIRATRLDECGAPPDPETEDSQVTSSGFISVAYAMEYEDGDEHIQKNADGELCINDRSCDVFKRVSVTITLCNVDPDLINLLTGNPSEVDAAGENVGFRISENAGCDNFAFELWSGIPSQDCDSEGGRPYGYLLLPYVTNGTVRDITVENGPTTFEVQAWTKGNGDWGQGPYNVVTAEDGTTPTALDDPILNGQHLLLRETLLAPPDATCGYQAMPEAPTTPSPS